MAWVRRFVGAGLYALFAKPTRHGAKQRKEHVIHGFRLGGGIVLLMGSLVACSQIAFGMVESGRLSRTVALFVALASVVLIFAMIRHWAKHFAGWVDYGVLNGHSYGHYRASRKQPLHSRSRVVGPSQLRYLRFTSALASVRFLKNYTLNAVDKTALITWLWAFTFAVDVEAYMPFTQCLVRCDVCWDSRSGRSVVVSPCQAPSSCSHDTAVALSSIKPFVIVVISPYHIECGSPAVLIPLLFRMPV